MQHPTSPYTRPHRRNWNLSWFLMQQHLRGLRSQPGPKDGARSLPIRQTSGDGPGRSTFTPVVGIALVFFLAWTPWRTDAATLPPWPYLPGSAFDVLVAEPPSSEPAKAVSETERLTTLALRVDSASGRPTRWNRSVGSAVAVAFEPRQRRLWLATSAHVVPCSEGCRILVDLPTLDGRTVTGKARIRWQDVRRDLALLSAQVPEAGQIEIARRSKLDPSHPTPITALGFPGTDVSSGPKERPLEVTHGIVVERHAARRLVFRSSSATEAEGTFDLDHLIFHTAAIAPGSSGGPLLDAEGALLGIHTGSLVKRNGDCLRAPAGESCLHLAVELEALWQELDKLLPRRSHASATPVD